jgi:hypothetical protein
LWTFDQILLPFQEFGSGICCPVSVGCPLLGEYGSVICSPICQWSESWRTRDYTLLSHLRLLGCLSVASYDSQGLRCKYSYLPVSSILDIIQRPVFYFKRNSIGVSVPHRKHIKSPLGVQRLMLSIGL